MSSVSRVPLRAAATHPRVLHCHDYAAIICIHTADTGSIYDNDFLEICKLFYAGFYRCGALRAVAVRDGKHTLLTVFVRPIISCTIFSSALFIPRA